VRRARGMSMGEPEFDEGSAEQQTGQPCRATNDNSDKVLPQSGSGDAIRDEAVRYECNENYESSG